MGRTRLAAVLAVLLGIALAGVVGFTVWHGAGHSYKAVETVGGDGAGDGAGVGNGAGAGNVAGAGDEAGAGNGAGSGDGAAGNPAEAANGQGAGAQQPGGEAENGAFSGEIQVNGMAAGQNAAGQNAAGQAAERQDTAGMGGGGAAGDSHAGDSAAGDPLAGASTPAQDNTVHLLFAGDVLLSDHVLNAYNKAGDISGVLDSELRRVIGESDIFMVNQEFPFSNRGTAAPDKQFTFRLPTEKVSMFGEMGIDIVTLANNHALDFGTDALVDTLDTLDGAGIPHVGAGRNLDEAKEPVLLAVKGKTIGFLGASRVIPEGSWNATSTRPGMLTTYDPAALVAEIKKLRERCDYLVVYVHWGIERDERPQEYQRALGQQYIDAGADLVIGSHPHVLQGLEYYKGKPIVYSLGNFVFGSSIPRTAILQADWDGETTKLRLVPATSAAGYTRMVTDEAKKQEFYDYMTGISYGVSVTGEGVGQ